jgi:hypothetical protein
MSGRHPSTRLPECRDLPFGRTAEATRRLISSLVDSAARMACFHPPQSPVHWRFSDVGGHSCNRKVTGRDVFVASIQDRFLATSRECVLHDPRGLGGFRNQGTRTQGHELDPPQPIRLRAWTSNERYSFPPSSTISRLVRCCDGSTNVYDHGVGIQPWTGSYHARVVGR